MEIVTTAALVETQPAQITTTAPTTSAHTTTTARDTQPVVKVEQVTYADTEGAVSTTDIYLPDADGQDWEHGNGSDVEGIHDEDMQSNNGSQELQEDVEELIQD